MLCPISRLQGGGAADVRRVLYRLCRRRPHGGDGQGRGLGVLDRPSKVAELDRHRCRRRGLPRRAVDKGIAAVCERLDHAGFQQGQLELLGKSSFLILILKTFVIGLLTMVEDIFATLQVGFFWGFWGVGRIDRGARAVCCDRVL